MGMRKAALAPHAPILEGTDRTATEADLSRLPAPEAALLRMRYGLGERQRTMADAAAALGISKAAAHRLHDCALQRLRWLSLAPAAGNDWDEV